MSHDEFTKLYGYMQQEFTAIRAGMAIFEQRVNTRFDQIYGLLDSSIKRHESQEQEQAAIKNQLTRHDKWIHELADKTDARLA